SRTDYRAAVNAAVDKTPSSRLRVVVLAMIIAVIIGLGWTYAMTPTGRTYVLHIAGQPARAKTASKGIIFRGEKPVHYQKRRMHLRFRHARSHHLTTKPYL